MMLLRPIVRHLSRFPISAITAALAACSHSEPFTAPDSDTDVPFAEAEPVRLTYADGAETEPAWLPDGSTFVYSYDRLGTSEGDRCLTTMRATGGTIVREVCNATPQDEFIADIFAMPSFLPDSSLAFLYTSNVGLGPSPVVGVFASTYQDPETKRLVRSVPFTGPNGVFNVDVASVRWLGPDRIGMIGITEEGIAPCPTCDLETFRLERDLLLVAPSDPTSIVVVPGVTFPTSITAGESSDIVYYTRAGDTRVYRRILSSGATTTIFDFGSEGIVRDIHFAGGRIAAIVGGTVSVINFPFGPVQTAGPGRLFIVDVATETAQFVAGVPFGNLYRHPALSPDGTGLVAEGYGPTSPGGNLWLFRSQ